MSSEWEVVNESEEGASWQEIQAAGEWRGLSSLSYISKPAIDDYASLMMTVDASSDEEPDITNKTLSLVLEGFRLWPLPLVPRVGWSTRGHTVTDEWAALGAALGATVYTLWTM